MEKPVTMPKLGATMTEGTVLRWLYQPGDQVTKGEPLLEIMTDKVNIEVEAPISGRLSEILAQDGDTLPIGASLGTLTSNSGESALATDPSERIASTPAAKREAALRGIDLQAVLLAGAKPPLNRNDVLAFEQQTKSQPSRPTLRA